MVWDTTGPRHLALVERTDVLVAVTGLTVPRLVADPSDPIAEALLDVEASALSEVAGAERYFRDRHRRGGQVDDYERALRLSALRRHPELRVLDLEADEFDDMEVMASGAFVAKHGLVAPLGRGERAVIAIAANREMVAGLDDGVAQNIALDAFGVVSMTTQDLLRAAIAEEKLSEAEASAINASLLANGFRGEPKL